MGLSPHYTLPVPVVQQILAAMVQPPSLPPTHLCPANRQPHRSIRMIMGKWLWPGLRLKKKKTEVKKKVTFKF